MDESEAGVELQQDGSSRESPAGLGEVLPRSRDREKTGEAPPQRDNTKTTTTINDRTTGSSTNTGSSGPICSLSLQAELHSGGPVQVQDPVVVQRLKPRDAPSQQATQ